MASSFCSGFPFTTGKSLLLKAASSSPSPAPQLLCFPASGREGRVVACAAEAAARKPRGIMKPRRVSAELQELVGVPEISRTEALKVIWAHIKGHNLQDPNNKRIIVCDEKLKKIFGGKDRVGFLEISGLITSHFL